MLTIENQNVFGKLQNRMSELKIFIETKAPIIIGKEAVEYFKENFQTESWEGTRWPEVQRRMPTINRNGKTIKNYSKGAAQSRKILTGTTGNLGRSIQYKFTTKEVTIFSDWKYAEVHNFGLRAGRGAGFIMPQRRFIGESDKLTNRIVAKLETHTRTILKSKS